MVYNVSGVNYVTRLLIFANLSKFCIKAKRLTLWRLIIISSRKNHGFFNKFDSVHDKNR